MVYAMVNTLASKGEPVKALSSACGELSCHLLHVKVLFMCRENVDNGC